MGYINASAEFQRHVNNTLGDTLWVECLAMVDDLVVANATKEEHRASMLRVFSRLARRQHSIKPSKLNILQAEARYLGHISTEEGLKPTGEHVTAITEMPYPAYEDGTVNMTSLRSFIGMCKYLRRYLKDCAKHCMKLNELLCNDSDGKWTEGHAQAWDALKHDVATTKGVWHPNYHHPLYVCTDGSKHGIGGYVYQMIGGEERVISYYSRSTTADERKWDTRELEILAIIATLEHFHPIVDGKHLRIQTDHKNLKYLMDMKNPTGRLGRWVMRLSEFDFELSYRKGKFMDIADCLSRNSQRVSTHRDDSEDVTAAKAEWMIMQLETGTTKGALFEVNLTGPGGRPFREEGGRNNIENSHLPDLTYNSDSDDEYDDEQSIMALACGAAQTNSDAQAYAAQVLDEEEEHEGRSQSRLDIPDGLKARFISERSMAAEQGRDPFCQQIVKELEKAGCKGSRHYVVRDGLLCKFTAAQDPKQGMDTLRPYVPTTMRPAILRNFHDSVFSAHKGARDTYNQIASRYFWHQMERDVKRYVSTCVQCQLAKARKPSMQGHVVGNNYNAVLSTLCMDLMGPLQTAGSGKSNRKEPTYLLVMVDPFSHRIWLEPIYSKHAEQVYDGFIRRILLEWGCPRAFLTDNGREFENEILKDMVKLLRIRHGFTPPYHPRGNYTERVNRCIGEWLRALVNTKSARKRDWVRYTKFVEFAYNSMFIPGTNISPYMASTGRQPLVPQDVFFMDGNGPPNVSDAPYKPLTDHVTELKADLEAARQEVRAARDKALEKQRVAFNAERIEETFAPGEMIRYFNDKEPKKSTLDGEGNEVVIGEISKLKLKNKLYEVVEKISPTTYSLKDPETGKVKQRPAHVTQIARVRFLGTHIVDEREPDDAGTAPTSSRPPLHEQTQSQKWAQVKAHSYVIFNDPDDGVDYISAAEVLEVEYKGSDDETMVVWAVIHRFSLQTSYKHNMPMVEQRLSPEYVDSRGKSWVTPNKTKLAGLEMNRYRYGHEDCEIIVPSFTMESGGKVPKRVCEQIDKHLRRKIRQGHTACLQCLNYPTPVELSKM